jgi:hypothetical protein
MPLPQPVGFQPGDEYKLQLSLDGDRVVTPWLALIGRRAPPVPLVHVELTRSGDALVGATATVEALSGAGSARYRRVAEEFTDPARWPKQVLVRYSWRARHEVDAGRGLTVMFAAGGGAMLWVAASVAAAYRRQLRQFVEDVAGDGGGGGGFAGVASEKAD